MYKIRDFDENFGGVRAYYNNPKVINIIMAKLGFHGHYYDIPFSSIDFTKNYQTVFNNLERIFLNF